MGIQHFPIILAAHHVPPARGLSWGTGRGEGRYAVAKGEPNVSASGEFPFASQLQSGVRGVMVYSRSCEYALRALTFLTGLPEGQMATVKEISETEQLPKQFLAKLLQSLARAGIVASVKGPGGGFALARPGDAITLHDVVNCIDGNVDFNRCAVGLVECADDAPCPLHDQWKVLRESIRTYLARNDLATLRQALDEKRRLMTGSGPAAR